MAKKIAFQGGKVLFRGGKVLFAEDPCDCCDESIETCDAFDDCFGGLSTGTTALDAYLTFTGVTGGSCCDDINDSFIVGKLIYSTGSSTCRLVETEVTEEACGARFSFDIFINEAVPSNSRFHVKAIWNFSPDIIWGYNGEDAFGPIGELCSSGTVTLPYLTDDGGTPPCTGAGSTVDVSVL